MRHHRRGRALRCLTVLLVLLAGAPSTSQAMSLMVEHFATPGTGINQAAYSASGYMGASHARLIVEHGPWANPFDWDAVVTPFVQGAIDHEMKPFLTLTGPATPTTTQLGSWCGSAATRYDGRSGRPLVLDYAVINEPNHNGFAAGTYRTLYRACRQAIKAVLPTANVYFGELEAGGAGACTYFDNALPSRPGVGDPTIETEGVAIHPYQYVTHPTTRVGGDSCRGIGNLGSWTTAIANATRAARIAKDGGGAPPILVSEFGYCTGRPPFDYPANAAEAACPQNAGGTGNLLDERTRADWIGAAYAWAASNGVAIFDYHGLAKRPAGDFVGNPNGYLWNSGIVDSPSGAFTPSVDALRAATGTQSPGVTTGSASNVAAREATLDGSVNPNGQRTRYRFDYGQTTAYGQSIPVPEANVGAGTGVVSVSQQVRGLFPGTTYHYRIVATSRAGVTAGADQTFRTRRATPSFDGDNRADLVATNPSTNSVAVTLSTGRSFNASGSGTWLNGWSSPTWMEVGDFNGDDKSDLAATDPSTNHVSVTTSTGSSFNGPNSGWWIDGWSVPRWMRVGDFNGDGKDDLAATDPSTNTVMVTLSTGRSFNASGSGTWLNGWSSPTWMEVGDFNGDGKDDLAATDPWTNHVAVSTSTGSSFNGPNSGWWIDGWSVPRWMRVGDFNGDGKDDLVATDPSTNHVSVTTSTGSSFNGPNSGWWIDGWSVPEWMEVGDFDGDGKDDLAATDPWTNHVAVTTSTGSSFGGLGSQWWTDGWSMPEWMRVG
jgi:hypothetical protein